jgi:hypothetical protein
MPPTEPNESIPLWQRPATKIAVGLVILVVSFGLTFLGNVMAKRMLGITVFLGLVAFGAGFHAVLWAPPRDQAKVHPALRQVITALLTVLVMVLVGLGTGFLVAVGRWVVMRGK